MMSTSLLTPTTEARRLVLVADDEQAILDLLTTVIGRLDLGVACVGDGAAAIAAVEIYRDKLLCVLMDIVMPVLNGVDAAHAIQAIAPSLPIVLMSGAIPTAYLDRIARVRLAGMLDKPFALVALRDLLRHIAGDRVALEKDGAYEQ
jgi:two-component system cell cycle sensor histidine kinase/response regulator CckA